MAPTTPTERPPGLRRSNTLKSDSYDLRTAFESLIKRMLDANRTRSSEGSTDNQVDIEGWTDSFIDILQNFPIEVVQVSSEENGSTPILEKVGEKDEKNGPSRLSLKRKKTRSVNIEALKKRCKKFQETCKTLTVANEELQQAGHAAATECERLTEDNKELREDVAGLMSDSEHLTEELTTLWGMFKEEKKRADDAEKERNEIYAMIARKRRSFDREKLEHDELAWELDVYRTLWHDPASVLALKRAAKFADEFDVYKEEEEEILLEVEEFGRNGLPNLSSKASSRHDGESEPTLNRRLIDQRSQITLLEMRLAKANAEQKTNHDQAILDLGFRLDGALDELQSAYKDRTTADIARDQALARVRKLETKFRMFMRAAGAGSKQASGFSAVTFSGITRISRVLTNIKEGEEEEGTVKTAGSGVMVGRDLATELEDLLDDVRSEVTTRITLDGADDGIIEKYNILVMDNARLLEDGARLQRQIQHLEDQAKRMEDARNLIAQNDGRVASVRVRELEKLICTQLSFYRDIRGLLATIEIVGKQVHDIEADVLRRPDMLQGSGAKVEELLGTTGQGSSDDIDIQEARETREAIGHSLQGVNGAGGMKLQAKWLDFNKESGKLAEFVENARGRLQDGARRLGIKGPETPNNSMVEVLAPAVDRYLSFVLVPLGRQFLFSTALKSFPPFLKPHMESYLRVASFLLAVLWALAGAPPAHFPRLGASDVRRVLWHMAILLLLQTYIALSRERNLWRYANASVTTAYLHDLQAGMCRRWPWGADARLMVFGLESLGALLNGRRLVITD